jgi:hypothetical protein
MFDKTLFTNEMKLITANVREHYDAEDAWELYEHANIAIQGAWYQGLVDKETMQKTIADFAVAAAEVEKREKEGEWIYGYCYRPL